MHITTRLLCFFNVGCKQTHLSLEIQTCNYWMIMQLPWQRKSISPNTLSKVMLSTTYMYKHPLHIDILKSYMYISQSRHIVISVIQGVGRMKYSFLGNRGADIKCYTYTGAFHKWYCHHDVTLGYNVTVMVFVCQQSLICQIANSKK